MDYVLEYPVWFIGLCLLCGALYALILYLHERLLDEVPQWLKSLMVLFRFTSVSIITFLLLGILIKNDSKVIEKPIIIIGQDNSESIYLNKDSSFYKNQYTQRFLEFVDRLSKDYQVEFFTFGENLYQSRDSLNFSDQQSDLASFLSEVSNRYQNRNIGAVVLASDGIYNQGLNPANIASSITNTGIYTVALGDTTIQKDLIIEKVRNNKFAYLGNDFPVEVLVKADKLKGKSAQLEILHKGKVITSETVNIEQSASVNNYSFRLEAAEAGVQKYTVRLSQLENEFSYENNSAVFFIDIQNNRQQILLLAHAPHPDLGAFKFAIESNDAYEVSLQLANNFDGNFSPYGLVIFHQLPTRKYPASAWLTKLSESEKASMFIWGTETNFGQFNTLKTGISHIGYRGKLDAVQASLNSNFSLFNISNKIKTQFSNLPVIHVPFGTIKTSGGITDLFTQKLGSFEKGTPLLSFNMWNGNRTAYITGEGVWRWRIAKPEVFKDIIQQTVQYLVTKEDKSFFRVSGKNEFTENDRISFDAEVFNKSYELINDAPVKMEITSDNGKVYNYDFSVNGESYRLSAGSLPVGSYTYQATALANGNEYIKTGEFSVTEIRVEQANTIANHQLLYNIAHNNGGEMVFPDELDALYNKITSRKDLVDIAYPYTKYTDLIHWKWLLFVIVALLSVEWFLRKRNGAY